MNQSHFFRIKTKCLKYCCKRSGIKKLLWQSDKKLIGKVDQQNMTVHRWFAAKSCPGDYLYNRHGVIVEEVNRRLGESSTGTPAQQPDTSGSFKSYLVRIAASVLNIRKGPGTNYGTNGSIKDKGVYTIVGESTGTGASKWGKMKSGVGWISLDYCKKL